MEYSNVFQIDLLLSAAAVALAGLWLYQPWHRKNPNLPLPLPLPPGPRRWPLIGNILDLPQNGMLPWHRWLRYKDIYGPVSSINLFGQTIILLSDKEAVHHLLRKNSAKTSGRPDMAFGGMCGHGNFLSHQQYDDSFRRRRKLVHQNFTTKRSLAHFHGAIEKEAERLVSSIHETPEHLLEHLRTMIGSTIMRGTYGYTPLPEYDPVLGLAELVASEAIEASFPSLWTVNVIPVLQYLPQILPGMGFKRKAAQYSRDTQSLAEKPYSWTRNQMRKSGYLSSYVSQVVDQCNQRSVGLTKEDENDIKHTAAIMYGAGSETTTSVLWTFVLAMVQYPAAQSKAQEEIDHIIDSERPPSLTDRAKLPYIEAIVQEVYRWCQVGPAGFPHVADDDLTYNGYRIPKGSILLSSVWWFLHDPEVFTEPEKFEPERFPNPETDVRADLFGYGRRVCPGREIADSAIFLAAARILAAFDIRAAVDEHGNRREASAKFNPGFVHTMQPFPCRIVPRKPKYSEPYDTLVKGAVNGRKETP